MTVLAYVGEIINKNERKTRMTVMVYVRQIFMSNERRNKNDCFGLCGEKLNKKEQKIRMTVLVYVGEVFNETNKKTGMTRLVYERQIFKTNERRNKNDCFGLCGENLNKNEQKIRMSVWFMWRNIQEQQAKKQE